MSTVDPSGSPWSPLREAEACVGRALAVVHRDSDIARHLTDVGELIRAHRCDPADSVDPVEVRARSIYGGPVHTLDEVCVRDGCIPHEMPSPSQRANAAAPTHGLNALCLLDGRTAHGVPSGKPDVVTDDDWDDLVDDLAEVWHSHPDLGNGGVGDFHGPGLHTFLGITWEQYAETGSHGWDSIPEGLRPYIRAQHKRWVQT